MSKALVKMGNTNELENCFKELSDFQNESNTKLANIVFNFGKSLQDYIKASNDDTKSFITKELEKRDKTISELEKNVNDKLGKVDYLHSEYSKLKNHPAKLKELKNSILKRVSSFFINRDTDDKIFLEYTLFYKSYLSYRIEDTIYSKIFNVYNIQSSGEMYIEDFDSAMKLISRWTPTYKLKNIILKSFARKYDLHMKSKRKNILKQEIIGYYEEYLNITQGGVNL
jgi:hypothetical protein